MGGRGAENRPGKRRAKKKQGSALSSRNDVTSPCFLRTTLATEQKLLQADGASPTFTGLCGRSDYSTFPVPNQKTKPRGLEALCKGGGSETAVPGINFDEGQKESHSSGRRREKAKSLFPPWHSVPCSCYGEDARAREREKIVLPSQAGEPGPFHSLRMLKGEPPRGSVGEVAQLPAQPRSSPTLGGT